MMLPKLIAIDGPAASGKTTLGNLLAGFLNYTLLDTGIMYRAVTCEALRRGIDIDDEVAVTRLAQQIQIDVLPSASEDGSNTDVLVDSVDITEKVRGTEIDANVSQVSAYRGVREAMVEQQRRIGRRGGVIMVGRDIGTVVFPEADLKIYLVASLEERAHRRFLERLERGEAVTLGEIRRALQARDEFDSGRVVSPLMAAPDAIVLDSSGLNIDEVFDKAKRLIK